MGAVSALIAEGSGQHHEHRVRALLARPCCAGWHLRSGRHGPFSHVRRLAPPGAGSAWLTQRAGAQRKLLAAAGGLEPIENRQALGEIEGLVGEVARHASAGGRAREQVPLRIAAAELTQLLQLRPALDAFGDHLDVQVAAMAMMALTIARSLISVTRSRTKLRSILSVSTRQRFKYDRLE